MTINQAILVAGMAAFISGAWQEGMGSS